MIMKTKIPRRILKTAGMTTRQWKQHKRYQARLLERAANAFSFASAYAPVKAMPEQLRKLVRKIRESLKVRNWGN